jgi:hypothetical protein
MCGSNSPPAEPGASRWEFGGSLLPGRDLKRVDRIAKEFGIDRRAFGIYLHECKDAGDYGSDDKGDYTEDELRDKAQEYKDLQGG